jgi:type IV secretion system protein VirD4
MVKLYDPDKNIRALRNTTPRAVAVSLFLFLFFYSFFLTTVFLINGKDFIMNFFLVDLFSSVKYQIQLLIYYSNIYISYIGKVSFFEYDYLLLKITSSFVFYFLLLIFIVYKKWNTILYWKPYKKEDSVHGDAHWAEDWEVVKAGLRAKKGLLMGKDKKGFLIVAGFQHTLLFAPTGSGKGVGFIIPNCVFWEESLICHDIKLENFEMSSKWRQDYLKQKVYCWVPADQNGKSHCYNPMDWISQKPGQMVDDVQKLANILLSKQEFWTNEARTLLVGVILWLIADPEKPTTFGEVVRTIRSDDFAYSVAKAMDTLGDIIHPIGYINLAAFLGKADKERSGVVSTLNSGLELWGNPIIDATTCKSDFNFMKFKTEPTTVFVGLTPDNISRLKPLMGMFYQQATAFMSQHLPTKEERLGVLFIMDEFPTVGKLEQFLAGIAYFRGYRVRLFLVVQDTQQLKGTYEDTGMNSFLSNSTYRVTFAANNFETAKLISDLIGTQTVESTSGSKSKFLDLNPSSGSISISQASRALLLPQEVMTLDKSMQIILIEAFPPVKTRKIFYYEEKFFMNRIKFGCIDLPTQEPILKKREKKEEGAKISDD